MLPKIDVPIYDLQLLSLKDKVRYRPFTVKEEKLFLMAGESNDKETVLSTIKQVANNCLIDKVNIDNLPTFDLEYLFINLRAKSVGEEVSLKFKCNNQIDGKKCNHIVPIDVNITEIVPNSEKKQNNKIEISEKLGIVLKYPSVKNVEKHSTKNESEALFEIMIDCIDYIYDNDEIFYSKDTSRKELEEFIDSLQTKHLEKIKDFFESIPKIKKDLEFTCNKCGYAEQVTVEGIESFFV